MSERISSRNGLRLMAAGATILAASAVGVVVEQSHAHKGTESNAAAAQAAKLSLELYDRKNFPKGVPVSGMLNGSVKVEIISGGLTHSGSYDSPVLLDAHNPKNLDGAWIGVPGSDAQGHAKLTAVEVKLGKHGDTTETVQLNDPSRPVLDGAAIYPTEVTNSTDQLMGFDISGNGNFPSRPIDSAGMK